MQPVPAARWVVLSRSAGLPWLGLLLAIIVAVIVLVVSNVNDDDENAAIATASPIVLVAGPATSWPDPTNPGQLLRAQYRKNNNYD